MTSNANASTHGHANAAPPATSHALPYLNVASSSSNSRYAKPTAAAAAGLSPPLAELSSKTPSHWQHEVSISYSRPLVAPNFHHATNILPLAAAASETSSAVAFHSPTTNATTDNKTIQTQLASEGNDNVRTSSSSMPTQILWPTHAHTLVYGLAAASAVQESTTQHQINNALITCRCKNCGNDSYANAVYSCSHRHINTNCANWHICLSCAIDHIRVQQTQAQAQTANTRVHAQHQHAMGDDDNGTSMDEDDHVIGLPLTKENLAANSHKATQEWISPGTLSINLGLVLPLSYDKGKLAKEHFFTRYLAQSLERDSKYILLRLALPCSLHPQHPLLFYPISPTPMNSAPPNSPLFCTALLSDFCVSHEFDKTARASYACRECNFRLCMPCFRSFLKDIEYQVTLNMSHSQAVETTKELSRCQHRSREIDDQRLAHRQTVEINLAQIKPKIQQLNYLLIVAAVYSIALINAMISQQIGSGFSSALLNSVIISIASFLPAALALYFYQYTLDSAIALNDHALQIEQIYLDEELHYNGLLDSVEPKTIAVHRLSAVAKELLQSLYFHQASYLRKQRYTMWTFILAYILDLVTVCLFCSSIVLLFATGICNLPTYNSEIDQCVLTSAVPIGLVLFLTFCYPRILVLLPIPMQSAVRMIDSLMTRTRENKKSKKRGAKR